jgi:hypothetical protein
MAKSQSQPSPDEDSPVVAYDEQQEGTETPDQGGSGKPKKLPIKTFRYPGSPGSSVELSVWENTFDLPDGGKTTGYGVSMSRSFKAGPGPKDWAHTKSFRMQDLLALQYGIVKVMDFLMENRNKKNTSQEEF